MIAVPPVCAKEMAALTFGKLDSRFDLRKHRAGREMPLGAILLGLGDAHLVERLLVGLAVVDADAVHGGQNDQRVGLDQLGQLRGGEILVDDGGGAVKLAVLADKFDNP